MEITPYCMIITACSTYDEAAHIANGLIGNKLAACVQLSEIKSFYAWEGQIRHEPEVRLMIKTRTWLYPEVEDFIRKNHSYSIPEIISVPIDRGELKYLNWMDEVTGKTITG